MPMHYDFNFCVSVRDLSMCECVCLFICVCFLCFFPSFFYFFFAYFVLFQLVFLFYLILLFGFRCFFVIYFTLWGYRVCSVFKSTEGLGSIPNTHIVAYSHLQLYFQDLWAFSSLFICQAATEHTHRCASKEYTHKMKINQIKEILFSYFCILSHSSLIGYNTG